MTVVAIFNQSIQFLDELPEDALHIYSWSFDNIATIRLHILLDNNLPINQYILPSPFDKFQCNSLYFLSSEPSSTSLDILRMVQNIDG